MEHVRDRRLDGFVMLGERTVEQCVGEQPADALTVHDERQPGSGIGRTHRRRIVRNVSDPLASVPHYAGPLRIPRLPLRVGRCAVVEDAPVERPAPRPVGIEPHPRRIVLLRVLDAHPAFREVALRSVTSDVDPTTRRRRAVVGQLREGHHLLAGLEVLTVDFFRDFVERRLDGIPVVHLQFQNRVRELAAALLIQRLHPMVQFGDHPVIVHRAADRRDDLILPLHPAAAVDERAILLDPMRRR